MNVKQRTADALRNECRKAEHDYTKALVILSLAMGQESEIIQKEEVLNNRREVYRDYQEAYDTYVHESLALNAVAEHVGNL